MESPSTIPVACFLEIEPLTGKAISWVAHTLFLEDNFSGGWPECRSTKGRDYEGNGKKKKKKKKKKKHVQAHMAVGQNQWFHFGIGAPPILVYFSGDWDVHWGYGILTHGHFFPGTMTSSTGPAAGRAAPPPSGFW